MKGNCVLKKKKMVYVSPGKPELGVWLVLPGPRGLKGGKENPWFFWPQCSANCLTLRGSMQVSGDPSASCHRDSCGRRERRSSTIASGALEIKLFPHNGKDDLKGLTLQNPLPRIPSSDADHKRNLQATAGQAARQPRQSIKEHRVGLLVCQGCQQFWSVYKKNYYSQLISSALQQRSSDCFKIHNKTFCNRMLQHQQYLLCSRGYASYATSVTTEYFGCMHQSHVSTH